jgi:hypothetical protein
MISESMGYYTPRTDDEGCIIHEQSKMHVWGAKENDEGGKGEGNGEKKYYSVCIFVLILVMYV